MDNILIMVILLLVVSAILIMITIFSLKRSQVKKYKKELSELDIEKNKLISVSVLSEISKVRDLVKTDNLKNKLDNWDNTFKSIKEEKMAKLTDMISDADYLVDKKDYKQVVKKIASIEMEIKALKKKADNLLEEIKIITESEERNRAIITKLKVMYRELQNKFERTEKDYGEIAEPLKKRFSDIDYEFQQFEAAMDNNDYVEVEKLVIIIEQSIEEMKKLLEEIPSIVLTATAMIPNRITEANMLE